MSRDGLRAARRWALLLTLSDSLLVAAVAGFMTALALWTRPVTDGVILLLWAALPVVASRLPRDWPRWRRGALVTLLVIGGALGWRFIALRVPVGFALSWEIQTALLVFWATAFLIVQPLAYRLFDALALGSLVIAILDGRPLALPWTGLALAAWFLTLALRHRHFDLLGARLPARPAASGLAGFGLMIVAVVPLYFGLSGLVGGDDVIRGRPVEARARPRRIGWGAGPKLSDLGPSERSAEPFFAILVTGADGRGVEPDSPDCPISNWLWRMRALDRFAEAIDDWEPAPRGPRTRNPIGPRDPAIATTVDLLRASSAAEYFPSLYGTRGATLVDSEIAGAKLVIGGDGSILVRDDTEVQRTQGDLVEIDWTDDERVFEGHLPDHLLLPGEPRLAAQLREVTADLARSRPRPDQVAGALAEYYRANFRYSRDDGWPRPAWTAEERLMVFLGRARRGDCNYFAIASCLLFRAAGIPARLAEGFVGVEWDRDLGAWAVIEGTAHVWCEYHDGTGWRPFDGTRHVAGTGALRAEARRDEPAEEARSDALDAGAPEAGRGAFGLVDRLLGRDERDSRLSMSLFLAPVLVLLAAVLLRGSDRRTRPRRDEIEAVGARPLEGAEIRVAAPAGADPRSRLLRLYAGWQRGLAARGRQRRAAETPRRHAARLVADREDGSGCITDFVELVDRCLYGSARPDEDSVRRFEAKLGRRAGRSRD